MPLVVASEHALLLEYSVHETPNWRRPESERSFEPGELLALVEFSLPFAVLFGPPNEEALTGHPLAALGLSAYSAYEVRDSSWIRGLEQMNRVHPHHRAENYASHRHFIFTFHDSTFECVARDFVATSVRLSEEDLMKEISRRVGSQR